MPMNISGTKFTHGYHRPITLGSRNVSKSIRASIVIHIDHEEGIVPLSRPLVPGQLFYSIFMILSKRTLSVQFFTTATENLQNPNKTCTCNCRPKR